MYPRIFTFITTENGNYACQISKGGCDDLTDCYSATNIGIGENEHPIFSVYPNPTSAILTVDLLSNSESAAIVITDMDGKIVYTNIVNINSHSIDVSDLSSGIYIISVASKNGASRLLFSVE